MDNSKRSLIKFNIYCGTTSHLNLVVLARARSLPYQAQSNYSPKTTRETHQRQRA